MEPISHGAFGDNMAASYTCMADDGAQSKAKREASMLASVAEKHLDEGLDHKEALKAATEAVGKCYEMGDKDAMADMLRLVIKTYLLRAGIARNEKASGAGQIVAESLKKAEQIAQGELALFRQAGCIRGQAAMLLSSADIILDKRAGGHSPALALQAATEAKALYRKLGDKKMEAVANLTLVAAHGANRNKPEALEAAQAALATFREAGDRPGEAKALHAVAQARVTSDTYACYTEALQFAKDALAVFEELGDKREQAKQLLGIAAMNLERDCPEQAIPPAKQAITIFRQIGRDSGAQTAAVSTLIQAHQALDEDTQALNVSTEGLAWSQNSGDKRQEVLMHDMLAHTHLKNENVDAAMAEVKEGLEITRELLDKEGEARLLMTQCQVQVRQQSLAPALKSVKDALALLKGLAGMERELGTAHHMRADVLCMTQEFEDAMQAARDAQDSFAEADDFSGQGTVLLLIAGLSGASNDALDTANQAQELFKKSGERRLESLALNAMVDILVASKDYEKALELANLRRDMLQEAGYRREEAKSLHAIAGVQLASGDAASALKIAREGMKMARAEGDKLAEVHMSIQAVHSSVILVSEAPEETKAVKTITEDATKIAKDAVALAKKVARGHLNGPVLYWQGQLLNLTLSPEATTAANGALTAFQREGDVMGEAHTNVLLAQCHINTGNRPKADELLQAALATFMEKNSTEGMAMVQSLMMVQRPMEGAGFAMPMMQTQQAGAASMGGGAVVSKGPDPTFVKNKIRTLVGEALDAEEISLDTPLMDSGLDSLASVSFRNEVSKEFNTTLPASLIFDYPTITSLTQYMIELLEDQ